MDTNVTSWYSNQGKIRESISIEKEWKLCQIIPSYPICEDKVLSERKKIKNSDPFFKLRMIIIVITIEPNTEKVNII